MGFGSFVGNLTGGLIGTSDAEKAAKDAKRASRAATNQALGYVDDSWKFIYGDTTDDGTFTPGRLTQYADYGQPALQNIQGMQSPGAPTLNQFNQNVPGSGLSNFNPTAADPQAFNYQGPGVEQFNFQFDENNPAYQWRLSQGLQATDRAQAAMRGVESGNRLMALNDYAQGAASQEYENEFGRQLGANQARNAAQAQGWGQQYNTAGFNNNVANDIFNRQLTQNQVNNQLADTRWNRGFDTAGFNNNVLANQYALNRQGYQDDLAREQYLADLGFGADQRLIDYNYRTGVDRGNLALGHAANTTAADMFQAKTKNDAIGGLASSVFGAAGAAGGFGTLFSDRRLKENVEKIGVLDSGLGLYRYNYIWGEPAIGVMADEALAVIPDAVSKHSSGYLMVDYSKVY